MNFQIFPAPVPDGTAFDSDGPVDAIVRLLRQKQGEEKAPPAQPPGSGRQSDLWNLRWIDAYGASHAVLRLGRDRRTACGVKLARDAVFSDDEVLSCPRCFARTFVPLGARGT